MWMSPPTMASKAGRIYYCLQVKTAPPTIVFFVNDPSLFSENYQRFLERKIRDAFSFKGSPIKMIFKGKSSRQIRSDLQKDGSEIGATVKEVLTKIEEIKVNTTIEKRKEKKMKRTALAVAGSNTIDHVKSENDFDFKEFDFDPDAYIDSDNDDNKSIDLYHE
jgi:hypothetical protein